MRHEYGVSPKRASFCKEAEREQTAVASWPGGCGTARSACHIAHRTRAGRFAGGGRGTNRDAGARSRIVRLQATVSDSASGKCGRAGCPSRCPAQGKWDRKRYTIRNGRNRETIRNRCRRLHDGQRSASGFGSGGHCSQLQIADCRLQICFSICNLQSAILKWYSSGVKQSPRGSSASLTWRINSASPRVAPHTGSALSTLAGSWHLRSGCPAPAVARRQQPFQHRGGTLNRQVTASVADDNTVAGVSLQQRHRPRLCRLEIGHGSEQHVRLETRPGLRPSRELDQHARPQWLPPSSRPAPSPPLPVRRPLP